MNVTVTASLIAGLSLIPVLASAQPFPAWGDTALIGAEGTDRLGNPTYSKNYPFGIPSPGFVTVQTMAAHGGVGTNNGYNRASGTFKTSVSTATPISQLNSDASGGAGVDSYLSFYDTFTIIGPPNQSGTFQYSLNISGGLTADVNCPNVLLSLQLNIGNAYLIAPNFMNNYSSWVDSNGQPVDEPTYDTLTAVLGKRQSKGGTFVMPAGSSIVIGTLLQSYAAGDNCAMNSGGSYLTLKAITPGFSFSTSSGLKYDKKPL